MKKSIVLGIFVFLALSGTAQVQTHVIGDSIYMHSNTGTGELILENSTKGLNGFLYNKGNGRTEFKRGLIKLNDSLYIIGGDTLNIAKGTGQGSGDYIHNQNAAAQASSNFWINGTGKTDGEMIINGLMIGRQSVAGAIGIGASLPTLVNGDVVIGDNTNSFRPKNLYFGGAKSSADAKAILSYNGLDGAGTDNAAQSLAFRAGAGTGTGLGGEISFFTATTGVVSGTTLATKTERLKIEASGLVKISTLTPSGVVSTDGVGTLRRGSVSQGITMGGTGDLTWGGTYTSNRSLTSTISGITLTGNNLQFGVNGTNQMLKLNTSGARKRVSFGVDATNFIADYKDVVLAGNSDLGVGGPTRVIPRGTLLGMNLSYNTSTTINVINTAKRSVGIGIGVEENDTQNPYMSFVCAPPATLTDAADVNTLATYRIIDLWSTRVDINKATNIAGAFQVTGNAYISGKQSIGTTANDALLHLAAGTATANTAPLKFTSGTTLTTPENGAVEYDGTNYFVTSNATRYALARTLTTTSVLNFNNTSAGSSTDLTITLTGAANGDAVSLGVPNEAVSGNGSFSAWVSAANTVTVRFSNNDLSSAIDPASGTFRVTIIKY